MRRTLVALALAGAATIVPAATASAKDINHDRIPDRWERAYHLSLKVDQAKRDQDHDGLKNRAEFLDHTSPRSTDSDHDGVPDGHEDADHDGVSNSTEQTPPESHGETPPPAGSDGDGSVTPPPAPGSDDHPPAGAAIVSYEQSPGFGGFLTIERPSGEHVRSYLGEKTDLECSSSPDGPFAPCSKEHLVAGTAVAAAEHGLNDYGNDVWMRVYLVIPESAG
jgi:hypothetical protein